MTEKKEHFMEKHKGPAKQFLALVGDDSGAVKSKIDDLDQSVKVEKDCYYIDNFYYSAKYGVKMFATLEEVTQDFTDNKTAMLCFVVVYKTLDELKGADEVAEKIKADMRVIMIESIETCPEHSEVEDFASKNNFEIVYLNSNKEQLEDAEELSEAVGIARLVEIIQVCNWPWRIINDFDSRSGMPDYQSTGSKEERNVAKRFDMGEDAPVSEELLEEYRQWAKNQAVGIPEPQHAERVHLSPDSPTTTEGTTNPDDVSISVDIDLVYENKEKNTEKASTIDKKKKEKTQ